MHLGTDADQKYTAQAQAVVNFRDKCREESSIRWINEGCTWRSISAVAAAIPENFYLSDFGVQDVAIVGPQVGGQLRTQAGTRDAVLFAGNAGLFGTSV